MPTFESTGPVELNMTVIAEAMKQNRIKSRAVQILDAGAMRAAKGVSEGGNLGWHLIQYYRGAWRGQCPDSAIHEKVKERFGTCDNYCGAILFDPYDSEEGNHYCSGDCLEESGDSWTNEDEFGEERDEQVACGECGDDETLASSEYYHILGGYRCSASCAWGSFLRLPATVEWLEQNDLDAEELSQITDGDPMPDDWFEAANRLADMWAEAFPDLPEIPPVEREPRMGDADYGVA